MTRANPAALVLAPLLGLVCGLRLNCAPGLLFLLVGVAVSPFHPVDPILTPTPYHGRIDIVSSAKATLRGDRVIVRTSLGLATWNLARTSVYNLGDELDVRGELRPLRGMSADLGRQQGWIGDLQVQRAEVVAPGSDLFRIGKDLRESYSQSVGEVLPQQEWSILNALTFNNDAEVPPDVVRALRVTGAIHILSTSGMHVMLLASLVLGLLKLLPIERWGQILVLSVLLLFYVVAAGGRPPALRAVALSLLTLTPYLWRRQSDALSALSLAFILNILWFPNDATNIGFPLSYVAVAALIMFARECHLPASASLLKVLLVRGWQVFHASCVATFATAPLLAYHFHEVSWIGPISNLLIGFAVLPIVAGGLASWALGGIFPWLSQGILLILVGPLCSYVALMAKGLSSFPGLTIKCGEFSPVWLVIMYGAAFLAWDPIQSWSKQRA